MREHKPLSEAVKDYVISDGTYYRKGTPQRVIDILDRFMHDKDTRLHFQWGDPETGKDWGDIYDTKGYIGRSGGPIKVPILLANIRSTGGGGIMTESIVLMEHANKKDGGVLYKHPKYHI